MAKDYLQKNGVKEYKLAKVCTKNIWAQIWNNTSEVVFTGRVAVQPQCAGWIVEMKW